MLLSLLTGGLAILNAAGFLLMAAGPPLLDFIVVSSIFSVASWLYGWALPAAVGYDRRALPGLRALQFAVVAAAAALILAVHPSRIGGIFIALMVVEIIIFPTFLLLFRSQTAAYLRFDLARGIANSLALVAVMAFADRSPVAYAALLLINAAIGGAALAIAGVHRPPPLTMAIADALRLPGRPSFWAPQFCALLAARGIETAALLGLGQFGGLSPVLSLKIGLALSSTLAVNARARRLVTLLAVHVVIYVAGTGAIVLAVASQALPLPATLALIDPVSALWVLPVILASYLLNIIGLRAAPAVAAVVAPALGRPADVAIIGTVGVPARYGGFETLAEQLAAHVDAGALRFTIYGQRSAYNAAERQGDCHGHRRRFLPLKANGIQSLFHDALALADAAATRRFDALLVLGVSGAWALPLVRLLRPGLRIVVNIDGMEWRRDKFGRAARWLLRALEWIAVRAAHAVIADNGALVPVVRRLHRREPVLIAYGGDHIGLPGPEALAPAWWLAIARIEPENNPGMILAAVAAAGVPMTFVGNWAANAHGRALAVRHAGDGATRLQPPVYDQAQLAGLRGGAIGYIHGHSVGGTNPSLVEALFHSTRILAFDCAFNRATLDGEGGYFRNADELARLLVTPESGMIPGDRLAELRARYGWSTIAADYRRVLLPGAPNRG